MPQSIKYVIAATPRAATAYMARLLTDLGLNCGHESFFKFEQKRHAFLDSEGTQGDASWLAVPFLETLPHNVHVFHQTRHPVNVIRSLLQIRFCDLDTNNQPVRKGQGLHFTQFAYRHCPALFEYANTRERAIWFYYHWNKTIEQALTNRHNIRYDIEGVNPDRLRQILNYLGVRPQLVSDELLVAHFALLPQNINAKTREKVSLTEDICWDDLPEEVQQLARSYGYEAATRAASVVDGWTDAIRQAQQTLRKHAQVLQDAWRVERGWPDGGNGQFACDA